MDKNLPPILINSYSDRMPFINICLYFLHKWLPQLDIYLTIDSDENFNYELHKNSNVLIYDNIIRTSTNLAECHSRYYRHYYTLKYFKSIGFEYVINYMDDGWIEGLNFDMFNQSVNYLEKYKADRIDLCGPLLQYELEKINDDISLVIPTDCTWYFHNQCATWRIDTLIDVYEKLGPVSDPNLERYGSEISRINNHRFITFNKYAINNEGCFQRTVGFNERGVRLLTKYCNETAAAFEDKRTEFNKFI